MKACANHAKFYNDNLRAYINWFEENRASIEEIFKHEIVREKIESIPSLIYYLAATYGYLDEKQPDVAEELLEDLYIGMQGMSYFMSSVEIILFILKENDDDYQFLENNMEAINFLFLMRDFEEFLLGAQEEIAECEEYYSESSKFIKRACSAIFSNDYTNVSFVQEGYDYIDKISDILAAQDWEYVPINMWIEEISLDMNLPLINLEPIKIK